MTSLPNAISGVSFKDSGTTGLNSMFSIISLSRSSPGATSSSTIPRSVSENTHLSVNISLTPIVNGLQTWTNELIPGLTEGEVMANLSGAGNYTSSSFHNVTFNMLDASTGRSIGSTYFLVIFRVSNHDFYVIKETNSTGSLYAGDLESARWSMSEGRLQSE